MPDPQRAPPGWRDARWPSGPGGAARDYWKVTPGVDPSPLEPELDPDPELEPELPVEPMFGHGCFSFVPAFGVPDFWAGAGAVGVVVLGEIGRAHV